MKYSILFILLLSIQSVFAQNFEGYVKYQIEISSKRKDGIEKIDMLYGVHGKNMTWYIKGNQYKKVFEGSHVIEEKIYSPSDNVLHEYTTKSHSYQQRDAADEPLVMRPKPPLATKSDILGYSCYRTDLVCNDYELEIYYSKKMPINPLNFSKHKVDHVAAIFEKSKAMPLKLIYRYEELIITYRATEVKRQDLSDDVFKMRENTDQIKTGVKIDLDHKIVHGSDKSYFIDVIGWMDETSDLSKTAEFQFKNEEKHMYLTVDRTPIAEIQAKGDNFNFYCEKVVAKLEASVYDPHLKEIVSAPINGMNVKSLEMTGDDKKDDETCYFQIGILEGKKNYYHVVTWTWNDEKGPRVPLMKKMIQSLSEE